jgi:hypothetical protein
MSPYTGVAGRLPANLDKLEQRIAAALDISRDELKRTVVTRYLSFRDGARGN